MVSYKTPTHTITSHHTHTYILQTPMYVHTPHLTRLTAAAATPVFRVTKWVATHTHTSTYTYYAYAYIHDYTHTGFPRQVGQEEEQ